MKKLNPFKKAPCDSNKFLQCEKSQASFVDREILVQQLMLAYIRDVRNLDVFISPKVLGKLQYVTNPDLLWEFCSSVANATEYGVYNGNKKARLYLGFKWTGLFNSLTFVDKRQKAPVLDIIEWVEKIDFTKI